MLVSCSTRVAKESSTRVYGVPFLAATCTPKSYIPYVIMTKIQAVMKTSSTKQRRVRRNERHDGKYVGRNSMCSKSVQVLYGFKEGGHHRGTRVCVCARVCVCRVGRACSFLWQSISQTPPLDSSYGKYDPHIVKQRLMDGMVALCGFRSDTPHATNAILRLGCRCPHAEAH